MTSPASPARRARLLVVDDDAIFLRSATALFRARFDVTAVRSGTEALARFADVSPDVALVDLGLPDVDGFEVTRRIKTELGGHLVPVIVVTASTDKAELARALAVGADDIVQKPFDHALAARKVDAAVRTRDQLMHLENERAELARYQHQTERDHQTAQTLMSSLLRRGCLDAPFIRAVMSPLSVFNADFILAARTRDGRLRGMLGDFAGHGLTAAIGTMPTADIFYGATYNNAPLEAVLRQINSRLRATMPRDLFCAAALFEIDGRAQTLTVWNGALPPLFLRRADGAIEALHSAHLPLGVLDDDELDETMQCLTIGDGDRLLGCTDGLTEQSNDAGELFGSERVAAVYGRADGSIDTLMQAVQAFGAGRSAADDVTLVEVAIGPELLAAGEPASGKSGGKGGTSGANEGRGVRVSVELGADLFSADSDPAIIVHSALIGAMPALAADSAQLFTVVAELVNNAVDYGVLKLDAQIKDAADGFRAYYAARTRALAQVNHGWVRVEASLQRGDGQLALTLRVLDSGTGIMPSALTRAGERRGRGIRLLQALCRDLRTLPGGRGVEVVYCLDQTESRPAP